MAEARRDGKPLCLVVYADWCARCKELAPVFGRPDVAALAEGMVMVQQDHDARPAWLAEKLGQYGQYVPRIFFFDRDGEVVQDLTSGHPRYPYFYGPLVTDKLTANMQASLRM